VAPLDKARCIVQVSLNIVKAITKFWKGLSIKKEKLTIDGDSLLMIYIYITLKSRVVDLFSQCNFITEFSTPYVRTTKIGYCLTTLEVALNHILNLSKEDLVAESKDSFESNIWSEAKQSLTKSIRESISNSYRGNSLII
jgi:hypothetical protein